MAIKISGTTVIDDSRNIQNIGVATATTFSGNLTGNVTGTASTASFATTSFGLSGSPNITVGSITSGNINSSGVVTATSFSGSGANLTGISSVSFATTSFGLSGTPSITVSQLGVATVTANNPFQVGSGTTIVIIDSSGDLGIGTVAAPTKLYLQGNAAANIVALGNVSGSTTLDFTQGNNFSMTLTAGTTLANPTGVTTGQSGILLIQEDGTGGYSVAWGSSWDFASATAPTLTTTASALNALPYFARSTTSIVVGSVIAGIGTL